MRDYTVTIFVLLAVLFAILSIALFTFSFAHPAPYYMEASFFGIAALLFMGIAMILKSQINTTNSIFGLYYYIKDELAQPSMEQTALITYDEDQLKEKLKTIEEDHPLRTILKDALDELQRKKDELPVKDLATDDLDKLLKKAIKTEDYKKAEEIKKEISNRQNET